MTALDIVILLGATALIAGLAWLFFGPRSIHTSQPIGGVQRIQIVVRGGYTPNAIRVRQGVPLEPVFDRQESGDCSSHVVFADFRWIPCAA